MSKRVSKKPAIQSRTLHDENCPLCGKALTRTPAVETTYYISPEAHDGEVPEKRSCTTCGYEFYY